MRGNNWLRSKIDAFMRERKWLRSQGEIYEELIKAADSLFKKYGTLLLIAYALITVLALYYLFVMPPLVVSGMVGATGDDFIMAVFCFAYFWILTAAVAYGSAEKI